MSIIERAADKLREVSDREPVDTSQDFPPEVPGSKRGSKSEHISIPDNLADELIDRPVRRHSKDRPRSSIHLDLEQTQSVGLTPPIKALEKIDAEFRRIKRPLLANITGRGAMPVENGRLIMITGAVEAEGKTFTAFNLARSMAQEPDWEIVLIDADNIRQTLSRDLGLQNEKGLVDALTDPELNVEEVLVPTDIPHLQIMPAGTRHQLAAEFFSSHSMELLLEQLIASHNRIILFDSSPLLGTADALVLAEAVGQILIVVKAGSTERRAVAAAIQPLDRNKAINFLLNQVTREYGDTYGGYYYGYSYGQQEDKRPSWRRN